MREKRKIFLFVGTICTLTFVVWTILLQKIDVQPLGVEGTMIGFATLNCWFHQLTGVHMSLYVITDWLGLVPIVVCLLFGVIGALQLIRRKKLFDVDYDILCLGLYYMIVIAAYLIFEEIPINYRPILIAGNKEVSYPSSTTLLVLCVMPTLVEQVTRRLKRKGVKEFVAIIAVGFSTFMVVGRLVSGVHWITDIIGATLLSTGLFSLYKAAVLQCNKKEQ